MEQRKKVVKLKAAQTIEEISQITPEAKPYTMSSRKMRERKEKPPTGNE